jgi:cellulose synthase operon protein C
VPDLHDEILELFDAGKFITAYRKLEPLNGLDALTGPAGRTLAGRLARNLGADRYGVAIHLREWRRQPDPEHLGMYLAYHLGERRGPVVGLKLIESMPLKSLTPEAQADILSARAQLLASLRDFTRAEEALDQAFALRSNFGWLHVVRGYLLSGQDRAEEGLESYRRALEIHPTSRTAIQAVAAALTQLNRVDEAIDLLSQSAERMESGLIVLQLAHLESEIERNESALEHLRQATALLPLTSRDRQFRKGLLGFESTVAYACGDFDRAIELAEQADTPYLRTTAEHLRQHRDTGRRVVLDVGFTLQHSVTCVPATLATLTEFWRQPIKHLEIASAICYDGTPAQAEREWLEKNGFYCREFTLTWDAARALIDAGIPFTQTLTGYRMGHMQAVIGYDSRLGVLIIRDPNSRHAFEYRATELIEAMQSTGPRGMAFIPESRRGDLESIALPDCELWDENYDLARKLDKHDRRGAWQAYERMAQLDAEHRLTTFARGRLASYDGERAVLNECTDKLLTAYPNDQNQWGVKLSLLRENGTREQRLKLLGELSQKPECQSVFGHQYVDELLYDPKKRAEAAYLLRRRMHGGDVGGQVCSLMAQLRWVEGKRDEALMWRRYAACLDDKDESRAGAYFATARALNRTDEALILLRDRFARFGKANGGPGRSLAEAHDQLYQTQAAASVLEEALVARPDDEQLKLFAASFLAKIGKAADAQRHLLEAKSLCREAEWTAAAARFAYRQNHLSDAWKYAEAALAGDPLNLSTHSLASEILADLRGPEAAADHLREFVNRYPENQYLRTLLIERVEELGAEQIETESREFLKYHPQDAWAWRELGFALANQRKWNEARQAAKRAYELEPEAEAVFLLTGAVYRGVGNNDKARTCFERAISLSADNLGAIEELMKLCDNREERRTAITKIYAELKRQTIQGHSLLTVRDYAATAFEPADTLRILLEARQARPDLWQTWSALVRQLVAMERKDDALKTATAAAQRFTMLPQTLLDLADVYLMLGDAAKERGAVNRALAIDSRNGATLRRSAETYRRTNDDRRERETLQRACESEPRNVTHRGALAECLWRQDRRQEAFAAIADAIQREPLYDWGWRQLAFWSRIAGEPDRPVAMAEAITASHPASSARWLQRARILAESPDHFAGCMEALDRAIEIDPRYVDAHDLRAIMLADRGDFQAALAACSPKVFAGRQPLRLAARAAIIERQRGRLDAAIAKMREVVALDSWFAFGWSKLADWLEEQGELEEALECSRRMLTIVPDAAASWGYVASGLLATGERDEARTHLRKSIEIDPSYMYGGQTLLLLDVEDKKYDDALATLKIIGPHLPEAERHAKRAWLLTLAGKHGQAIEAFQQACEAPLDEVDHLAIAVDALLQSGQAAQVRETLLASLEKPSHPSELARSLVDVLAREGNLSQIEEVLRWLPADGQDWAFAAAAYADALGDAQAAAKVASLVKRYGKALRAHTRSWSAAGAALQQCGMYEACREWMQDWQSRTDADAGGLRPLAVVALALDDFRSLEVVAQRVDELPATPAVDAIRLLNVCTDVARNDLDAAQRRLEGVRTGNLNDFFARLHRLVVAAVDLANSLDNGSRWAQVQRSWNAALRESGGPNVDDVTSIVRSHCERMLLRRQSNWARRWTRERAIKSTTRQRQQARQRRIAAVG